jgi:hypothetical protein
MRRRWTTAVAASCGLLASCSLVTSWDGLTSSDAGAHGGAGGGATTSATTGSGGSGGTADDAGDASDAPADGEPDAMDPPLCTAKHHYCGGHVIMGTATKLYVCSDDGSSTSLVETCTHGCLVRPLNKDDHCRCLAGGYYCGGDHIEGDPSTLYRCNVDGSGTLFEHCTKGCIVTPGKDDSCG